MAVLSNRLHARSAGQWSAIMTTFNANPDNLAAALAAASIGDTLLLAAGT